MSPLRLAWYHLVHKRARTTVAAGGVAFAVILIFLEVGLLGGVDRTATMLFDRLNFDLLIASAEYLDLSRAGEFPRSRLAQARAADGVADVIPLAVSAGGWRLPSRTGPLGTSPGGEVMSISLLAVPPALLDKAFVVGPGGVFPSREEAQAAAAALARLDAFLFDRRSKPEFGDPDRLRAVSLGLADGDPIRLNDRQAQIVGHFEIGTGFSWNGLLLSSEETLARFTGRSPHTVDFGLVQLRPGSDPLAVQRQLRAILPPDVTVFTRAEITALERRYWLRLTSVGQFLSVAVVLAVVVGIIFVYQMMAADIRNLLPEYATVKALGYRPPFLTAVVLWQAALLALFGFVPGFVVSLGLYAVARQYGGIPTAMTAATAAGVLVLDLGMCLASGLLAVRKVQTADPADLF